MTESEFKIFFDRNFNSLRSYLYYRSGDEELATDLAQDTLLRIWEKQLRYEGKRTVGLAYKIAGDLFVNQFRKQKKENKYLNSIEFEFTDISPEKQLQYKEMKEKYENTLAKLGEKQRVVFLMSRLDGMKYSEIAECLRISVKAVEKRMGVALSTFREVLKALFYLLYLASITESLTVLFYNIKTQVL